MSILSVAHPPDIPLSTRLRSFVYTAGLFLGPDNPFLWWYHTGKNPQADLTGPYFVLDAPFREVEPGRAVIASPEYMKELGAYLFTGTIQNAKGDPIPNATVDLWHASFKGDYYFYKYEHRGKVRTDSTGRFEVLSTTPGEYLGRAGHFHFIVTPSIGSNYQELTTQSYVCKANDPKGIDGDPVNWARKPRYHNIIQSWAIPNKKGERICDFPSKELDTATATSLNEWKDRLNAVDKGDIQIVAGGHAVIQLEERKGWW